jgi:LamB porin
LCPVACTTSNSALVPLSGFQTTSHSKVNFPRNRSNNTNGSGFPGFGKNGWLGVFDVGPVIKPKGGYYTKPEIRFFATYATWSDSLKGMATPVQEWGTPFMPPYNGNTNHGWLFGTQVEWFF